MFFTSSSSTSVCVGLLKQPGMFAPPGGWWHDPTVAPSYAKLNSLTVCGVICFRLPLWDLPPSLPVPTIPAAAVTTWATEVSVTVGTRQREAG